MGTIRIKPSHPSQGEYVLINEADFNPEIHSKLGEPEKPPAKRRGRPPKVKELDNGNC